MPYKLQLTTSEGACQRVGNGEEQALAIVGKGSEQWEEGQAQALHEESKAGEVAGPTEPSPNGEAR